MSNATAAQRRFWTALVNDGCELCGAPAEVAHLHGGSIVERMGEPKAKGKKLVRYNWLALNLCPPHGRIGPLALDTDVAAWEATNGPQSMYVDRLSARHRLDLWALARQGKK